MSELPAPDRPHEYLRVIAATLPKRLEKEAADRPLERMTDEYMMPIPLVVCFGPKPTRE